MPVRTPYYNLHQVVTGQYTVGNEFILTDGSEYIGEYHILPNNQRFTESRPTDKSVELFPLRFEITPDSLIYNKINKLDATQYVDPQLTYPIPTNDDYDIGWILRYFVQKRNSENIIIEIDQPQFGSINTKGKPGLNGVIWNGLVLKWRISKMSISDISYLNQLELQKSEHKFPGIGAYITNLLEFWK